MGQEEKTYLKDYKKPSHHILKTDLVFEIFNSHVLVENSMQIVCTTTQDEPLVLDGIGLDLVCLKINGVKLTEFEFSKNDDSLVIHNLPSSFKIKVVTKLYPETNTALEGLYRSQDILCTQNEPQGFRRITYFIDRPDNMSLYTTTIIAQKSLYPVLLSNGNLIKQESFTDGTHMTLWHDPYPKPSYLFALVAGDLGKSSDTFTTSQGNQVELNIYTEAHNIDRCSFALDSLKQAMKWDESEYGLIYDLDLYNIVAVDSFNMGAMENKGLNIFNTQYILADKERSCDDEFVAIQSVVAHEYFHNYTGNRITCRDWFELTLKEGLTVFRDQCFSADMHSHALMRIDDVSRLREYQFSEDASDMAHPIKPDHYLQINNFYTATIYEKGAEVIGMLYTMLGKKRWRLAMDNYFSRYDGMAIRTGDFLAVMQEQCNIDLKQFELWYTQERTPKLIAKHSYNQSRGELTLKLEQVIPNSVKNIVQEPYLYPLKIAIFADKKIVIEQTLIVSKKSQEYIFQNIHSTPTLSLNRGFSAPIILEYEQEDLISLIELEEDGFIQHEAMCKIMKKAMLQTIDCKIDEDLLDSFASILLDESIDHALKAKLLKLPSIEEVMLDLTQVQIDSLLDRVRQIEQRLGEYFSKQMLALYKQLNRVDTAASRALKNLLLGYMALAKQDGSEELIVAQYNSSDNMSDRLGALKIATINCFDSSSILRDDFYHNYHDDKLTICKLFSTIALIQSADVIEEIIEVMDESAFDITIPNHVRALIGSFTKNYRYFHAVDGSGYRFVCDMILKLDSINPQIASRLTTPFKIYKKLPQDRALHMHQELMRLKSNPDTSSHVYEIVELIIG